MRPPDDGGAGRIVAEALSVVQGRTARGKPASLVGGMLAMVEHLEPAEMMELAQKLPALLSAEARAVFAGAAQPEKVPT